jgi:hypothetical protein
MGKASLVASRSRHIFFSLPQQLLRLPTAASCITYASAPISRVVTNPAHSLEPAFCWGWSGWTINQRFPSACNESHGSPLSGVALAFVAASEQTMSFSRTHTRTRPQLLWVRCHARERNLTQSWAHRSRIFLLSAFLLLLWCLSSLSPQLRIRTCASSLDTARTGQ